MAFKTTDVRPEDADHVATHLALCEAVSRGWINNDRLVAIEDRIDELQNALLCDKTLVRQANGLYTVEDE